MKEEGIEPPEESPKKEGEAAEGMEEGVEEEGEGAEGAGESEGEVTEEVLLSKHTGRPLIPLACSHCKDKCITFRVYARHLVSHRHKVTMAGVALRHNQKLAVLRAQQRAEQRRLEEELPPEELLERSQFCGVCRLSYRQTAHAHGRSEAHQAIRRLLLPFCTFCRMQMRSPMQYEHHLLSLDHIKRKARKESLKAEKYGEGKGDEGLNVDLDNFMTIDSVGDVDEIDDSDTEKKNDESVEKRKKAEINVGSEHIKKIEVLFCDLCKVFITRGNRNASEEETNLRRHCRLRMHLTRYVKHRDTRNLRQHAERIHRIHQMQSAADKDTIKKEKTEENHDESGVMNNSAEKGKEVKSESANSTGVTLDGTEGEEKLWADVDKDLGDLLREVDQTGNKSSDDEDESNTGRYDRFRKSEKKTDNMENLNGKADTDNIKVKAEKAVAQPAAVAAEAKQAA